MRQVSTRNHMTWLQVILSQCTAFKISKAHTVNMVKSVIKFPGMAECKTNSNEKTTTVFPKGMVSFHIISCWKDMNRCTHLYVFSYTDLLILYKLSFFFRYFLFCFVVVNVAYRFNICITSCKSNHPKLWFFSVCALLLPNRNRLLQNYFQNCLLYH